MWLICKNTVLHCKCQENQMRSQMMVTELWGQMVDCDALDSELLLLLEEDIWRSNKAIPIATSPSSRYCYQWKLSCFSTGGGIEGAWLKVLHALYQPTRGLRMSWLLQCVHLHVCMCSDRKINNGVMYISTDLILGIISFWTTVFTYKIGDISDWAELQSFVIESQDMLCKLNHT